MFQIFGLNGRMGRGTWWMIQIGTIIVGLGLHYIFDPTLNFGRADLDNLKNNPDKIQEFAKSLVAAIPLFLVTGVLSQITLLDVLGECNDKKALLVEWAGHQISCTPISPR